MCARTIRIRPALRNADSSAFGQVFWLRTGEEAKGSGVGSHGSVKTNDSAILMSCGNLKSNWPSHLFQRQWPIRVPKNVLYSGASAAGLNRLPFADR